MRITYALAMYNVGFGSAWQLPKSGWTARKIVTTGDSLEEEKHKKILGSSITERLIRFFSEKKSYSESYINDAGDLPGATPTGWMPWIRSRYIPGNNVRKIPDVGSIIGAPALSSFDSPKKIEPETSRTIRRFAEWNAKWVPQLSVLNALDCRPQASFRSCFEHCQELIPRPKVISLAEVLTPGHRTISRRMMTAEGESTHLVYDDGLSDEPLALKTNLLVPPDVLMNAGNVVSRAIVSAFLHSVLNGSEAAFDSDSISGLRRRTGERSQPRKLTRAESPYGRDHNGVEGGSLVDEEKNPGSVGGLDSDLSRPDVRGYDEWGALQLQKCVLDVCVTRYLSTPVPGCLTSNGDLVKVPNVPGNVHSPKATGPEDDAGNFYDKTRQDFWKQIGYYEVSRVAHMLDSALFWRCLITVCLIVTFIFLITAAAWMSKLGHLKLPDHWRIKYTEMMEEAGVRITQVPVYLILLWGEVHKLWLEYSHIGYSWLEGLIKSLGENGMVAIDETERLIGNPNPHDDLKSIGSSCKENKLLTSQVPHQPFSDDATSSKLWMPTGQNEDIPSEHSSSDGTQRFKGFL